MNRRVRILRMPLIAAAALVVCAAWTPRAPRGVGLALEESRIYFEYNQSDADLGVHVFLDGEDWRKMEIRNPAGQMIFGVKGKGGYKEHGMTELFFEGAEPSLAEVPLEELLDLFPEGEYEFSGVTVDGEAITGEGTFTHAVPDGPAVSTMTGPGNFVQIGWSTVMGPAPGFPNLPIVIEGYQVIVDSFQVTLPDTANAVTLPPEFVATLGPGTHGFEVLAIEEGGNQTITQGSFTL